MTLKFWVYDRVRIKSSDGVTGTVLDNNYRYQGQDPEVVYTVFVDGVGEQTVPEEDLEKIGRLEPPLADYAVVEILPGEPERASVVGKRGLIVGNAWDPKTGKWYFAVTLQHGEVWYIGEAELKDTGRTLPPEVIEERWGGQRPSIAVNPSTGETVAKGEPDTAPPRYGGYVPLPVDLDEL